MLTLKWLFPQASRSFKISHEEIKQSIPNPSQLLNSFYKVLHVTISVFILQREVSAFVTCANPFYRVEVMFSYMVSNFFLSLNNFTGIKYSLQTISKK